MGELLQQAFPLLIAGLVSSILYLMRFLYVNGSTQAEKAIGNTTIIFPAGASVIGGLKTIYFSFNVKACDITQIEQVYVCLGGLVVFLASSFDVYRKIKDA